MCINRDSSPPTCLCGCSLKCGIITVAVFEILGLLGSISSMQPWSILGSVIQVAPIVALLIYSQSRTIANINYIWKCCEFGFLLVAIVAFVFILEFYDLPHHVCSTVNLAESLTSQEEQVATECEKHARFWMYIAWGACIVIAVPIQYLIVSIFKAYRDEIKEDDATSYNQLP